MLMEQTVVIVAQFQLVTGLIHKFQMSREGQEMNIQGHYLLP